MRIFASLLFQMVFFKIEEIYTIGDKINQRYS